MIHKKEVQRGIYILVVLQIFLLMNSSVAYSYEIHEIDKANENKQIISNQDEENKIKGFLVSLFSIKEIGFVSATTSATTYQSEVYDGEYKSTYNSFFSNEKGLNCCKEMFNGAICQNVPTDFANCTSSLLPMKCQEVSDCKIGCCYDEEQGLCDTNSPQAECTSNGGKWSSEANCNNLACQKGCCLVGSNTEYTTERRCQFLSSQAGFQTVNFDQKLDIISCLQKQKEQKTGACILSLGMCTFGTESDCVQKSGKFEQGMLCSNPSLNTTCAKQFSVNCAEDKDEIYWFDSCGNRENIYSSNKNQSWNGGFILNKSQSCNPNSANIDSVSCGNCNYDLGSSCEKGADKKINDGNFICKEMNCIDENGKERINGESWCVYDGVIGNGTDVVGSRHWRRACVDGEIVVEPCADFRQELCAEGTQINDAGKNISLATCRTNRWKNCITITSMSDEDIPEGETKKSLCERDSDCFWKEVKIGDRIDPYCLPQYPTGFDFWNKKGQAKDICDTASQKCTYVYDCHGCVANCDCVEEIHTQRLNDFCTSLGDCGGYVNIKGDYTAGGYSIVEAPKLGDRYIAKLKELIKPIKGQFCKIGKASDYGYSSWDRNKNQGGDGDESNAGDILLYTAIGVAVAAIALMIIAFDLFFVLGVWMLIAAVVLIILWLLLGNCEVETTEVIFTCKPWSAPTKDQKCESCNGDLLKPCSQYRCKSLGAACVIENANSENPICFEDNKGDVTPPTISFGTINESLYKVIPTENGVEVKTIKDDCIPEFTPVLFTINTSEYATCKVEYNRTNSFDEMNQYFGDSNLYDKEHMGVYNMINIDYLSGLLNNDKISEEKKNELIEKFANMDMYIRCQDNHGNFNTQEYNVRFCVKNGPDLTPPVIIATSPKHEAYLTYGQTSVDARFFVIEPAECKYSFAANKSYDEMENEFECDTDVRRGGKYGWECNTTLNDLTQNQTNIYIKCKDQPWLELPEYKYLLDEGRARNTNAEDSIFTLYQSKGILEIESIGPTGVIDTGFSPASVTLTAKTKGGAKGNGDAVCRYLFVGKNWSDEFFETGGNTHTNIMSELPSGEYDLRVNCKDKSLNTAQKETHFNLKLDKNAPVVIRLYRNGANLAIKTDEKSSCAVDYTTCFFNFENATKMEGTMTNTHEITWKPGFTYYVKCKDIWGNYNNECNIKVSPDVFGE